MNFMDVFFNWDILRESLPAMFRGLLVTLKISVVGIVFGTTIGLGVALLRLHGPKPVKWFVRMYIDVIRAVPVMVMLILVYFALPFADIRLSSFAAASVVLVLFAAAYAAEVFRGGISAVPPGQIEAAKALGINVVKTFFYVTLPQATRVSLPAMTSNWVSLVKETSLASTVALPELLKEAIDAQAYHANPTPLIGSAIIYVVLLFPLVRLVSWLEHRTARHTQR